MITPDGKHEPKGKTPASGLMQDWRIREYVQRGLLKITPFVEQQTRVDEKGNPLISYGLSSTGYDFRLARKFMVFRNSSAGLATALTESALHALGTSYIDPKKHDPNNFIEVEADTLLLPPGTYALGTLIERIELPSNVMALFIGKSTYARAGVFINTTPAEPMWKGHLTVEIGNLTPRHIKLYAGEGICQGLFFESPGPCDVDYSQRSGKYNDQPDRPVPAKV